MGRKYEPDVKRECTKKQLAFVREYLIDHNGKEAAIRAGYSKKYAKGQAFRLLQQEHIQEALQEMERKVTRKCQVTAERIVKELALIAFADITEIFDDDGNMKPIKDLAEEITRTIKEIELDSKSEDEYNEDGEPVTRSITFPKKIKMNDKLKALELLGKFKGMFKETIDLNGNIIKVLLPDDLEGGDDE